MLRRVQDFFVFFWLQIKMFNIVFIFSRGWPDNTKFLVRL